MRAWIHRTLLVSWRRFSISLQKRVIFSEKRTWIEFASIVRVSKEKYCKKKAEEEEKKKKEEKKMKKEAAKEPIKADINDKQTNPNLRVPNKGNGLDFERYSWTQTIQELDDDEPTEKIVSTSRYSKFDLGQYPDFDLGQYSDFDDVSEEETTLRVMILIDDETAAVEEDVVDDNEEEVTTVNEHVEHPFCNSYNPEEEEKKKKSPKKSPQRKCHGSITGTC
ncbi:hypothetical protein F3Y22_tig00111659pilonHSYRG00113 [Hibiscus syriacus]|uniref:Uncharacterized protein n=1 Tax=Hibiscus syriacus TaxID=106335 RepID=A0A6A2XJ53_HIBSY|nr:hypothetical protein F3Y22_tig00111659pilonHSYRG00113 [Hibiscus syriacus]